jgi:hypothetical protein
MKLILLVLGVLGVLSCGSNVTPSTPTETSLDRLEDKYLLYKDLVSNHQDSYGFIYTEHCDATLFSGLLSIVKEVELEAAKDSKGQWFRRPTSYTPCFTEGVTGRQESASTISRDMFLGIYFYIWRHKRLDLAEEILKYGIENDWVMGQGEFSRTFFSPNMRATLAEIIFQLGGPNHLVYRSLPVSFSENEGFGAHLTMLHIMLRGELLGSLTSSQFEIVRYNYTRTSGKNAFYSYIYHKYSSGDFTEVIEVLMDSSIFPSDRLPSTSDFCADWKWQRDPGTMHWQPCDKYHPVHEWSGADFLFVAKLVLENFEK